MIEDSSCTIKEVRKDIGCKYICRDFKRFCKANTPKLSKMLQCPSSTEEFEGDITPIAFMMYLNEGFIIKHTFESLISKKEYSRLMRLGKAFDTVSKAFSIGILRKLLKNDILHKALRLYEKQALERWAT